jgi:hypothetical protein
MMKRLLGQKKHIPVNYKSSDYYIVEFPKSGITWFSFLLSNTLLIESQSKIEASFYNIQQLIPDVQISRQLPDDNLWDIKTPRFIKSHHSYNLEYNNIIYLVRRPEAVMKSYHNYLKEFGNHSSDLHTFVKSKKYGLEAWNNHVYNWIHNIRNGQRLHLIRYEDLLSNPNEILQELFKNLGINISNQSIAHAVKRSNREFMVNSENLYKKYSPGYKFNFVGKEKNRHLNEESRLLTESIFSEKTKNIIKTIYS